MKKIDTGKNHVFDKEYLWILALIAVTFVAYLPSLRGSFTNWDDGVYIKENPYLKTLTWSTIKGIFSSYFMGNYHPLAMLSLAFDYKINQFDPFVFHLTNLILHLANSLLVYFCLRALTRRADIALAAAFLFGLHTLHVESVAWVSERKDVLYAFFYLLAMYSYIRYTDIRRVKWYILALLFFILSCFSKGQAVTFAFTLMLIDFFKERQVFKPGILVEKIPFFLLSLTFGIVALYAQQNSQATTMVHFPLVKQVAFASYGLVMYILKLILPVSLSAFYPYPVHEYAADVPALYWACILPALGVIAGLWFAWKHAREIFFALAFFLLNIILLIQLFPVGSAIMADRYAYIPSIGYCFLFGWFLSNRSFIKNSRVALAIAIVYLLLQGVLTFNRTSDWKNSMVLWTDVISKDSRVPIAWFNRGNLYVAAQDYKNAISDYSECLKADSDYLKAYVNMGESKSKLKDYQGAIRDYNELLRRDSANTTGYINRALAKKLTRDLPGSLADYNTAIRQKPEQVELYPCRGGVEFELNDHKSALADYDKAIQMSPKNPAFYSDRALIKKSTGDFQGALDDYNTAIGLGAGRNDLFINRGKLFLQTGEMDKALLDFSEAIRLNPKESSGFRERGGILFKQKKYTGSLSDLSAAISLDPSDAESYVTRACIKKELHDIPGARTDMLKAISLNPVYATHELTNLLGIREVPEGNLSYSQCYEMGMSFEKQGKFPDAIRQYRKAVELKPDYAEGWHSLGKVLGRTGQLAEAVSSFNKSITLRKRYFEALTDRAIAKATMGKTDDALNDLDAAISINPDYDGAYFNRALIHLNTGKKELACADLKKAVSLGNRAAADVARKVCNGK
ncbi:MAG: tetratricopeptide repeat protein [Bacteroidota bacterium]